MRALVLAWLLCAAVAEAQVQDLGHKLPAGAGLDAGTQVEPGVYVGDRVVWFAADRVKDRGGATIPIAGLDLDAIANVLGIAGTLRVGPLYLGAAVAVPLVKLSLDAEDPRASVDRLGLGDVFVEPLKVGTRRARLDLVGSYALYAPTGQGERRGPGRPQWSHQVSAGGTAFFDERRGWRLSVLASYFHHQRKQGIDITRGDVLQLQGGVGGRIVDGLDAGLAGYALWQVTDDRGTDLPDPLRGARERAFGLGPEVALALPSLRARLVVRLAWDLDGRARPVGTTLVVGVSMVVWR